MQAIDRSTLFEEIFHTTRDRVYAFIKKLLKDDSKVQDCMQQCYMRLWESMDRIDTASDMLPLLYTYARNGCIDQLRKNARYVWLEDIGVLTEKMNVENEIEARLRQKDLDEEMNVIFQKMPSRRRQVFRLVKLDGFTYREVSQQLNISISTVEKHMHAASRSLPPETAIKLLVWLFVTKTIL